MADNEVTITLDRVEEMLKAIGEVTRKQVLVGITKGSAGRPGEIDNAALGYIHEYGSPAAHIPERPWLFPPINRMQHRTQQFLQKAGEFATEGKLDEAMAQLEVLGMEGVKAVKTNIVSGGDPPFAPNAPSTVARKGSDKPLIDTGQLLNSVTYVVRNKG